MSSGGKKPKQPERWKFPVSRAESVMLNVIRRREALLNQSGFDSTDCTQQQQYGLDAKWIAFAQELYSWRFRTHYAAVVTGLLALATEEDINPLCLLERAQLPKSYSATGVWRSAAYPHLREEGVFVNNLGEQPFNNSPYNGEPVMAPDWDNADPVNNRCLLRVMEELTNATSLTRTQAETALVSFLVAPLPAGRQHRKRKLALSPSGGVPLGVTVPPLVDFASTVEQFITVLSDDGRRAQAFIAAVLEVGGYPNTHTQSIHDPSRNYPGDVTARDDRGGFGPIYVEVKDKVVNNQQVTDYATEVKHFNPDGIAGYAALANTDKVQAGLRQQARVNSSTDVSASVDFPMVIWRSPLEALLACGFWSGEPQDVLVWKVGNAYVRWLDFMDGGRNSGGDWQQIIDGWGIPTRNP